MKIVETKIPNVLPETIDESKQVLADNIIRNVYPLFNEVYHSKVDSFQELKENLARKKEIVSQEKANLESIMAEYKRKKKISKLLDRIEKLVTSGLVYDGHLKNETVILLKIVNKLPNDKLDYHLRDTLQTISKRFSR
jgi:hypothetical protein